MRGTELRSMAPENDFGVVVDKLNFHQHVSIVVSRAYQILGIVKRTFVHLNIRTLPLLFKTLVRPHLEYGNYLWHQKFILDADKVKRVQRRATKFIPGICRLGNQRRRIELNSYSRLYRRRRYMTVCANFSIYLTSFFLYSFS